MVICLHTLRGKKTLFIFNPDLSGCITVKDIKTGKKLDISGEDLKDLISEYELYKEPSDE